MVMVMRSTAALSRVSTQHSGSARSAATLSRVSTQHSMGPGPVAEGTECGGDAPPNTHEQDPQSQLAAEHSAGVAPAAAATAVAVATAAVGEPQLSSSSMQPGIPLPLPQPGQLPWPSEQRTPARSGAEQSPADTSATFAFGTGGDFGVGHSVDSMSSTALLDLILDGGEDLQNRVTPPWIGSPVAPQLPQQPQCPPTPPTPPTLPEPPPPPPPPHPSHTTPPDRRMGEDITASPPALAPAAVGMPVSPGGSSLRGAGGVDASAAARHRAARKSVSFVCRSAGPPLVGEGKPGGGAAAAVGSGNVCGAHMAEGAVGSSDGAGLKASAASAAAGESRTTVSTAAFKRARSMGVARQGVKVRGKAGAAGRFPS